ncbi:MAG TPA: hypothetical protein VKU39_05440 [Streptosporangiaceae bacterium]|nr:hypothetical protein [Streptosporangiaceae bacterium]
MSKYVSARAQTARLARTSYRDAHKEEAAAGRAKGLDAGLTVLSYMIAGMVAYGAIGWLIGNATHLRILFPLGMLVGIAVSVGFVIYRYGRQGAADADLQAGADLQTDADLQAKVKK